MKKRGVILTLLGIALLIVILTLIRVPQLKRHAVSVSCGNNMIALALATRLWVDEHDNRLPNDFRSMSNEINATKILICPADASRQPGQWSTLSAADCTYEILTPGAAYSETNVFFRCPIHGYQAYPNGSVYDGTRRLKKGLL